jgi:hypothetical protein
MQEALNFELPQWRRIVDMLRSGPKTTNDFCSAHGLASEYRRAICDARNKGYGIEATPITRKNWEYRITHMPVGM